MNSKTSLTILLSIGISIGSGALNFQEFLMGSPATAKNLFVTFSYIAIWIIVLIMSTKIKNHVFIKCCYIFWAMTLFTAGVSIYANITGNSVDWALPLVALLLGQWYGIMFIVDSFLVSSIIIAALSLLMLVFAIIFFKYDNKKIA